MSTEITTEHPHIVRKHGTCGGSPIIKGTRITVRHIAVLWKQGETVEEINQSFPHLRPSWVHDAISYYLDHPEEIDQEIEATKSLSHKGRSMRIMGHENPAIPQRRYR